MWSLVIYSIWVDTLTGLITIVILGIVRSMSGAVSLLAWLPLAVGFRRELARSSNYEAFEPAGRSIVIFGVWIVES